MMEEEGVEDHRFYREVFDVVGDGILYCNKNGKIVDLNGSFTQLTGFSSEELIGKNVIFLAKKMLNMHLLPGIIQENRRAVSRRQVREFVISHRGRELQFRMVPDQVNGGTTTLVRDITSIKLNLSLNERYDLVSKALAESSARLIKASSDYNIYDHIAKFLSRLFAPTFVHVGRYLLNQPGYSETASYYARNKRLNQLIRHFYAEHLETRYRNVDAYTSALESQEILEIEDSFHVISQGRLPAEASHLLEKLTERKRVQMVGFKDSTGQLRAHAIMVFSQNKEVDNFHVLGEFQQQVTAFFQRIDYLNSLEESNQELQKVNEELDNLVYRISHDLKAPITSIKGLNNLLIREKDQLEHYLHMHQAEASRLEDYVTDILTYSQNSRLSISAQEVNLPELVDYVLNDFSGQIEKEGIQFQVDTGEVDTVVTDIFRIKVILNVLISNSVHYCCGPDPLVTIKARIDNDYLVLLVEDNGEGIHEMIRPRIWQMFYRGSEKSKGSGLGLYILKETVRKLCGTVDCESEYGSFTRFTVKIPLQ